MCGESWLTIKASSQGCAPGSCSHIVLVVVYVFCLDVSFRCVIDVGDSFLSFLISLSSWYAVYNNAMYCLSPYS